MKSFKHLAFGLIAATLLSTTACFEQAQAPAPNPTSSQDVVTDITEHVSDTMLSAPVSFLDVRPGIGGKVSGFAGHFLSSQFAQSRYDWARAGTHLDHVLALDADNQDLIKRAMVLSVGAGDLDQAAVRALQLLKIDETDGLALLVASVDAVARGDNAAASAHVAKMREGDLTSFLKPLVSGWVAAGEGSMMEAEKFSGVGIHLYHGAAMALMLGKNDVALDMVVRMMQSGALVTYDAERAADILAALGRYDDARALYQGVRMQGVADPRLDAKIAILQRDGTVDADALRHVLGPLQITNAAQGIAAAMYDMAYVLFHEQSDTSAKIFARLALALNPELTDARVLLGEAMARNDRMDEAIEMFSSIPEDHPARSVSQRRAAELMAQAGRTDEAVALLERLFTEYGDIDALVRLGDLHREQEDYARALDIYNRAARHIGGDAIPEQHWYLLYARGMTYERKGRWVEAEADLKNALAFRPDNPYVLNYLGYSWADQGINLDQSLEMLERAVSLKPSDGHITDSMGWVLYRLGRYQDAIPYLEQAVELLPYDSTVNDHLGDAYWRAGRKLEARYQWQRALNNAERESQDMRDTITAKLESGLGALTAEDVKRTKNAGALAQQNAARP